VLKAREGLLEKFLQELCLALVEARHAPEHLEPICTFLALRA